MMETAANLQAQTHPLPTPSSQERGADFIRVEHFQHPAGEGTCYSENEHTLSISLAPRPVAMLHVQGGKSFAGMYGKGDMALTPAKTPLFARWESDDNFMQIRLSDEFVRTVAREALERDCDRLELLPVFRTRNAEIEAIGRMLLAEVQQEATGSRLYLDSLANILAVNLLRQHAISKPQLPIYEGGLPHRQLQMVLDYIDAHLDSDITLVILARLLDMSQFHFSRLFKQSIGLSPHQYLLQQRVERAKQLLKQTDRLILDIALDCGFNSHSHLSKQFRQFTGMTPKAYRAS